MSKIVYVETISMHKCIYAFKVEDDVKPNEVREKIFDLDSEWIHSEHIIEVDLSAREVTEDEYIKVLDAEAEYLSDWSREKKLECITDLTE